MIVRAYRKQGDTLKKGDKLFLIDSSYEGFGNTAQPTLLSHLEKKKQMIEEDIQYKEKNLRLLKGLLEKKYISLAEYHAKHDELRMLKDSQNSVDMEIIS